MSYKNFAEDEEEPEESEDASEDLADCFEVDVV